MDKAQGIIEPAPISGTYFTGHSGYGSVPTGTFTLLRPVNLKRRWFNVVCPIDQTTEPCRITLPRSSDLTDYAEIVLNPGMSLTLSMSGDMPWQGSILAQGLAATSYVRWTECEDYP